MIFKRYYPRLCAILIHTEIISLNTQTKSVSMSMRRCVILDTGYIGNKGIFKAFAAHWESPSDTKVYTPKRWKTELNDHIVSYQITVQIQVHAHNESQLPNILVSVTTLLQCSVVYMSNFFSTVKWGKNERCLVCSELTTAVWSGHLFHLNLDFSFSLSFLFSFFIQTSNITCPNALFAFGPTQCPLKVKE